MHLLHINEASDKATTRSISLAAIDSTCTLNVARIYTVLSFLCARKPKTLSRHPSVDPHSSFPQIMCDILWISFICYNAYGVRAQRHDQISMAWTCLNRLHIFANWYKSRKGRKSSSIFLRRDARDIFTPANSSVNQLNLVLTPHCCWLACWFCTVK